MDAIIDEIDSVSLQRMMNSQDVEKETSIYSLAEMAMRDVRNKFLPEKESSLFPVDIRKIIQRAGIRLYEISMNVDTGFQLEKVNGYIRHQENGEWAIFIESDESEYSKRYVMAHEFCHFLMREMLESGVETTESKVKQYCIDPLFPKNKCELYADMMAAFLMFPHEAVLKCMEEYAQELKVKNTYPMDGFEWMRVLGHRAKISSYFTIISYQYLKYFLCEYYSKTADDEFKQKYGRFFR